MSDLDDLKLVDDWTDLDVEKEIARQRKARADFEMGLKPKKDKQTADVSKILESLTPPKPKGTFRR